MTEYLYNIKKKYPTVKILTNFGFAHADGKIKEWQDIILTTNIHVDEIDEKKWNRFLKYHTYKQEDMWTKIGEDGEIHYYVRRNHGVIFGFDEIQLTFRSTEWQNAPDDLLDYISQQRKYHKMIIGSAQIFNRIDIKIKEQANYVVDCKCLLGRLCVLRFYDKATYIQNGDKFDKGARKRRVKKRYCFVAYDEIRMKYDTEEIMNDLLKGKSELSKLQDILESIRGGENV